jgi:hypothetical protein
MTALRRRLRADRPRRGLAPKTQPCPLAAVNHLAHDDQRVPDQLRAAEIRPYCLSWLNEQQVAASP